MNTNKLLVAAVLAAAIGAPIAGFLGETKGQSMTSTGVRFRSFTASRLARPPVRSSWLRLGARTNG